MADKFDLILSCVLGLTLLSGATASALALKSAEPAKPMQAELFKVSLGIFQTGVGAIIGLLGGHAL
jgi:hypothetical protein